MITLSILMRTNAASCLIFGLLFLILPSEIATYLSSETPIPTIVLVILGIGLIINGGDLIQSSLKPIPTKSKILYFSIGDFIWAIVSISLVLLNIWITSKEGAIATLLVAFMVAIFGLLQMMKRDEIERTL